MSFLLGPIEAGLSAAFESKPDVPDFQWIDLAQQQLDTARGNLGVLPQAEELGGQVNAFMRGERAKTLAGIPGLSDLEALQLGNLKSWLRGELSPEQASQIQRATNAHAFAGGYGASNAPGGMANLELARNYGIGALQLAQSAMPMANQYTQQQYNMRATPEFNPSSMFIDPMAAAQFNSAQRNQQFQRDWLSNRIAAQPEPWQQSIMNSVQQGGAMGDSLFGSFGGGMLGGMGGGGNQYSGPGQSPSGWSSLSPYMQNYYNSYAAAGPYGAGINFE